MVTCSFVSERCSTQQFISLMQKLEFNMEKMWMSRQLSGEALSVCAGAEQFQHWRSDEICPSQTWFRNLTQKVKTEENVEVEEEMRFMNGDNPAVNFECGNQHGGHYCCPGCDGHLCMCHNLDYMAQRKYRTLTEWQQQVLVGRKRKEAKQLPLQTEFPVFWEFLGILKNSQLCK